jgi:hypothetical protein
MTATMLPSASLLAFHTSQHVTAAATAAVAAPK